jgi:amidase
MTEPADLSATAARHLIGAKKLSPIELIESCLARIAETNGKINSVVAIDEAVALARARNLEAAVAKGHRLGILHGLPIGIKDAEPVKGMRSTSGSLMFAEYIPDADAPMVANLRAAGANIFCKTNMPEFGAGGNTRNRVYGATGNPFNLALTVGGSSGGSAAALAATQMPLATGSDYAGSLRTPSAFCATVGFRPSVATVPAPDRAAGLVPWGVLGPMGRSVADAYLLLRAQVDACTADPFSVRRLDLAATLAPADLTGMRVAISVDMGEAPVSNAIRQVFSKKAASFRGHIKHAEQAHPDFSGVHEVFEIHRGVAYVTAHQGKLKTHRDLLDRNVIDDTERGLKLTMEEVGRGYVEQHKLMKRVISFFERFDVLITPTASVSPFPHAQLFVEEIDGEKMPTYTRWLALAYMPTMALCCSCAIPCGRDHKNLPFGIQIIGSRGSDLKVLSIALALEEAMASDAETARPVVDWRALGNDMAPAGGAR